MKKSIGKRLLYFALGAFVLCIVVIFICNGIINRSASGKLYADAQAIPFNKVGLLLGTSKYLSDSSVNLYYRYRIEAVAALIKQGKIRYLVISGDNSRKEYNEPAMMKEDLVQLGIDSGKIYLDYAGFRTFDSMIRLKKIFGQTSVTVISQQFHNERAIYLATQLDIQAIGFNAKDVSNGAGWKVQLREKLARVKVFADQLTNKKPRFLGEKIVLPE